MKNVILGIKDYCKDCWHDFWFWFWDGLDNFVSRRLHHTYCWQKNEGYFTKEGNLRHYIKQRKIATKRKENGLFDTRRFTKNKTLGRQTQFVQKPILWVKVHINTRNKGDNK